MTYNYKEGKARVEEILKNYIEVEEAEHIPSDKNFTFKNAYYSWVTAVFVDIRNSTELFTKQPKKDVSRIIRSFTSEVIEILRNNEYLLEIGIRGDCVYATYSSPNEKDEAEIFNLVCYINTLISMLNKLFNKNNLQGISVGIGMATGKELVVKAGRPGTGINSKVWIGKAVTMAANLSSIGNKNNRKTIILSSESYKYMTDEDKKNNLFSKFKHNEYGTLYESNAVMSNFNNWIKEGMKS